VRQSYRRRWGVPGGLLKKGERAEDAARREVLEEVGLAIELVGEPAVVVEPVPRRIDLVFRARPVTESTAAPTPRSPEIVEARWFAPDALPELQLETSTALIALARSASRPQAVALPPDLQAL
jgi:ADP-ribose pyrophosphatase YjhB (NUDIX family)